MAYDGSLVFDTHVDVSGFSDGTDDINKSFQAVRKGAKSAAEGVEQLPDALDEAAGSTSRLSDIVKGSGAFRLIEQGVDAVVSSLDSAIDRYDTMNRFPLMLQQMGYGADEADAAVQRLSQGIQGLPTTLDSVVSTAQRLTILTDNLDQSVDTTIALNNAFLASGASSDGAARGLEQYVQMLSKGEADLESWRTLQETMGLALNRVAEAFGYAGESAVNDLYAALQSGEITFSQFNSKLIQLNEGVGGFADLAKTSSVGIKTAWTNLSTSLVRGTADIIESIDRGLSRTKFESIQNVIETTGEVIEGAMNLAAPAIELVASNADILAVSIAALTAAYGANKVVTAFTTAQKAATAAVIAADAAGKILIPTLKAQTLEETASTGAISLKNFALVAMTGNLNLATVASGLLTAATTALSAAIKAALGPAGLIVLGLSAIAAAVVAVYKAETACSEAYTEQTEALDALAEAQEEAANSIESSEKAAKDNLTSIRASADASKELARQLGELSSAENKTASQKQRMGELVDQLNEKYADLCLTYDEEADRLNMNTQQLQDYLEAQQTMEEAAALQERYNELLEEESTIRQSKAELDEKERELAAQLEQQIISTGEYNELLEQLNATRAGYIAQEEQIAARKTELDAQMTALDTAAAQTIIDNTAAQQAAAEAAAEAEEQEMQRREDALQSYTDAATNMFDQISTESKISVGQMIENLRHNQEAVANWANNLVALGERGLDQGLLQQLRDAGPESAATVAELVSASDDELSELSEVFRNGTSTATDALLTELGLPEVTNSGSEMVDNIADGVDANSSLTTATTQLVNDAQRAAKNAAASSGWRSVGRQMISGITSGVRSGAGGLLSAIRAVVRDAVNAAERAAQINSPSRLFRDRIGLNIMKGWALGIDDGEPLVARGMVNAMDALRREIAGGMNPAGLVSSMRESIASLQGSVAGNLRAASAAAWSRPSAAAPGNVYRSSVQNVYFEQPMQAPDEIARALRIQNTYGLAGAR